MKLEELVPKQKSLEQLYPRETSTSFPFMECFFGGIYFWLTLSFAGRSLIVYSNKETKFYFWLRIIFLWQLDVINYKHLFHLLYTLLLFLYLAVDFLVLWNIIVKTLKILKFSYGYCKKREYGNKILKKKKIHDKLSLLREYM